MTRTTGPTASARIRHLAAGAVFGAVVVLAPISASAQSAEEIVRGWLDAMRGGGASVESAGLTYSRGSDTLEIRDLRITPPNRDGKSGATVRVPSVVFVGLTRTPAGGLTAKSMAVGTVEATAEDGSARGSMAGIEATNIALPNFSDLAYDPKAPFRSQMRILKTVATIRAERLRIGRVEVSVPSADEPFLITYDGVSVTDFADGRIGRFTSGAMTAAGRTRDKSTGQDVAVDVKIGKSEVVGYDIGAYTRVMDDESYKDGRGDGVWRDVLKSASLDGIDVSAGPVRFSMARGAMGAMRMRQFDTPPGAMFDRIIADPKAFEKDEKAAMAFTFGILRSMAIESYTLDGWSVTAPDLDRFLLGRFAIRDLSPDGLGEYSLDGVDIAAKGGGVRLARFAFGGIKFPAIGDVMRAIEAGKSGVEIDPQSVMPTLGFLKIDGVEVDVPGKGRVGLGSFSVDLSGYIRAIPTAARVVIRNVQVPTALVDDRQTREMMAALGYDKVDYSGELALRWDEPTGDFRLETLTSSMANVGTITVTALLGNVPRALFEDPKKADQHLLGLVIKTFAIAYKDASFADRALKVASAKTKQTPEALRNTALAFLPQILAEVKDPARKKRMSDAIAAFIARPGTITISSQLATPLPVLQIVGTAAAAPQSLPDLLKLEAAVSP